MRTESTIATKLRDILPRALNAELDLEEFYAICSEPSGADELLRLMYSDVEDAITHTPGRWPWGGVDKEAWRSSELHKRLCVVAVFLEYYLDWGWHGAKVLACYRRLREHSEMSVEDIRARILEELQDGSDAPTKS